MYKRQVRVGSFGAEVVGQEFRSEMDSHADTCVVSSKTSWIVNDSGRPVKVHGYDERVSEKAHYRTVSGVVAYDDPTSGETYMLVVHQAIEIPSIKVNLLSPMQMRDNDLAVNEEPKHMALNPTDDHHCIQIGLEGSDEPLVIPLSIQGVTSYFPTRKPTQQEWDNSELDMRLELSSESIE